MEEMTEVSEISPLPVPDQYWLDFGLALARLWQGLSWLWLAFNVGAALAHIWLCFGLAFVGLGFGFCFVGIRLWLRPSAGVTLYASVVWIGFY